MATFYSRVRPWLPWISLTLLFPTVGWLTGWFVGASQSPVVGTLLPLIFGLMGALTYGLLDRANKARAISDRLKKELDPITHFRVECVVKEESGTSMELAGFWALGVLLFCAACYFGVERGFARRVPQYPPIEELIGKMKASPAEMGSIYALRLHFQSENMPVTEAKAVFHDVIQPILAMEAPKPKPKPASSSQPADKNLQSLQLFADDPGMDSSDFFYNYTRPWLVRDVVQTLMGVKREARSQFLPYTEPFGRAGTYGYGGKPIQER